MYRKVPISLHCKSNLTLVSNACEAALISLYYAPYGLNELQLNLSTQRPSWGQKKVAIVERFKLESMHGLSAKTSGHCGEVVISRGSTVQEMHLKFPFNTIGILRMAF